MRGRCSSGLSFKFEFKIDYDQLTKLLDAFLKRHADELLGGVIAPCLVLKTEDNTPTSLPESVTTSSVPAPTEQKNNNRPPPPVQSLPVNAPPVSTDDQTKMIVDNKPIISDEMPEDPFQNLFQNSNQDDTRFKDRNNIYNKKWNHDKP